MFAHYQEEAQLGTPIQGGIARKRDASSIQKCAEPLLK